MRLHEQLAFHDILVATAERGLSEQLAEKGYYVTEAPQIIAPDLGEGDFQAWNAA